MFKSIHILMGFLLCLAAWATSACAQQDKSTRPSPPAKAECKLAGGKTLTEVAWTYAARLQRIKDVPSRLKTLLNDIKNRAGSQGFNPEEVLEELKRHHCVKVDAQGRVQVARIKPTLPSWIRSRMLRWARLYS